MWNKKSYCQNPKVLRCHVALLTHSHESEMEDGVTLPSQQDTTLAESPLHSPGD